MADQRVSGRTRRALKGRPNTDVNSRWRQLCTFPIPLFWYEVALKSYPPLSVPSMTRSKLFYSLAFLCLVVLGCGGGSGSTVTGDVTFNGKPLEKGYVTFTPADSKSAPVGAEVVMMMRP